MVILLGWSLHLRSRQGQVRQLRVPGDVGLTEKLSRMHEIDFADVQPLDVYSVEDAKAVDMVESGNRFSDGNFAVHLPWKGGVKTVQLCVRACDAGLFAA